MKTSRLKNIVIAILLLVNVFLLALLLSRQNQQRAAHARSVEQLNVLLSDNGIAFDTALLNEDASISAAELSRSGDVENAFAEKLLGQTDVRNVGGGIYVYESKSGSCQFRSNGAIDGTLNLPVSDPIAFCEDIFRSCAYEMDEASYAQALAVSSSGSGTISALRKVDGLLVFAAPLSLTFENNILVSVSGIFLSNVSVLKPAHGIDAISALVRFLDYRNANGLVCTEITCMEYGYLFQDSASVSSRLVPVWHISTGLSDYYVNLETGAVTRG
ncbi:MAG: hypothetical protein Q3995_05265 [Eubacteriales bacterium]|nr:hypothetical protein [Eubacteriales bacterium]